MKFIKANTYCRYNHYDEAITIFLDIIEHHKQHQFAEFSANLLLDIYSHKKDFRALHALIDRFEGDPGLLAGRDNFREVVSTIKRQLLRKNAERLEKDGKANNDSAKFVACGQVHLDIYNRNPEAADNDVELYSAGMCFKEGKAISAAISAFSLVEKYYPNSKISARAIAALGKAYGDIAFYDRASDKLEQYAKKYASEKDAYAAMSEAVFFRKGLGDDAKAIEDVNHLITTLGRKKPQEAAVAMFSLTTIYEKQGNPDALIKHLRDYIRLFGNKGGADRLVVAYAKLGETLWHQSCPVKEINGVCIQVIHENAISSAQQRHFGQNDETEQRQQCGPESTPKLIVVKRDERGLAEALEAFAAVTREYKKRLSKAGDDDAAVRGYYALVRLAEADSWFETYLGDLAGRDKAIAALSTKRLDDWLDSKSNLADSARRRYGAVLDIKDPATSLAAYARIGQLDQRLADQLLTAEVPRSGRTGELVADRVTRFCDALNKRAQALEALALKSYAICLARSTRLGWFNEWSRLCERELGQAYAVCLARSTKLGSFNEWSKLCEREFGQMQPGDYPATSELHGMPDQIAPIIETEAPVLRLDSPTS